MLTVAANPEVEHYQHRYGTLILRNRHMHWLDLSVPEAEPLITPAARTFLVEEISERGLVQPALAL